MKELTEILMSVDNDFQLLLGRSDMFCQIVRFVSLTINIKYTEPAGAGFVVLLRPDRFSSVQFQEQIVYSNH